MLVRSALEEMLALKTMHVEVLKARNKELTYALELAEEAITETGRYTIWLQVIRKALHLI